MIVHHRISDFYKSLGLPEQINVFAKAIDGRLDLLFGL